MGRGPVTVSASKLDNHKSGVVTDVCVAFPTLSALAAGYEVFVVVDASGTSIKTSATPRSCGWRTPARR